MTMEKIKALVKANEGVLHNFRFKGTRNQIEEFNGKITEMYPTIFIVVLDNDRIRPFSYSDVLLKNFEILD